VGNLLEFVANNWFVSIVGGLLVTFSWEMIKLFLEKKAYNRQIKQVRYDFSMIIKSIIGEQSLPSSRILESLLKGIAQKHKVKFKDVSEVDYIFHALTGDVMESNFLDYNQKILFCEKIGGLSASLNKQIELNTIITNSNADSKLDRVLKLLPVLIISSGTFSVLQYSETLTKLDKAFFKYLLENPIFLAISLLIISVMVLVIVKSSIPLLLARKEQNDNGSI